eukprot:1527412-Rhodomonas_salina.1
MLYINEPPPSPAPHSMLSPPPTTWTRAKTQAPCVYYPFCKDSTPVWAELTGPPVARASALTKRDLRLLEEYTESNLSRKGTTLKTAKRNAEKKLARRKHFLTVLCKLQNKYGHGHSSGWLYH